MWGMLQPGSLTSHREHHTQHHSHLGWLGQTLQLARHQTIAYWWRGWCGRYESRRGPGRLVGTTPQLSPASLVQRDGDQILDLNRIARKFHLAVIYTPPPSPFSLNLIPSTIHSLTSGQGNEPGVRLSHLSAYTLPFPLLSYPWLPLWSAWSARQMPASPTSPSPRLQLGENVQMPQHRS